MTEEEIYERGLRAYSIIHDDSYNELCDVMFEEISKEILLTPLEDKETREKLYLTIHGMRAFNSRLVNYAVLKKNIEDDRNRLNEQDEQDIDF